MNNDLKIANKVRLIALYLPQFHSIPENDKWWGNGFTEWTNVRKAKPLFKGHVQPRVPAELGYYNLLDHEIRQKQADLAKEYGIEGFCYWHYWFGNGKRLLERPFNELLETGAPDFPFCLGWANHTWYEKIYSVWKNNKLLIKQTYPGIEDYTAHFNSVLPAFLDKRYITVDNKPLFLVFAPLDSPEIMTFLKTWQELAVKHGLPGIYFVGQGTRGQKESILNLGFNAYNDITVQGIYQQKSATKRALLKLKSELAGRPTRVYKYKEAYPYFVTNDAKHIDNIPIICPNWDHSPRSGKKGFILKNAEPEFFREHVSQVFGLIKEKPYEQRIAIIKSWNEWGEGNYLEPDVQYGRAYLEVLRERINLMF